MLPSLVFFLIAFTPFQAGDKLQGKWKVTGVMSGNPYIDRQFTRGYFVITGARLKILKDEKGTSEGEFEIVVRPDKNPKEVDFTFMRNGEKLLLRGIYELKGDALRIALSRARKSNVRPHGFAETGGDHDFRVFELKRVKK